MSEGVERQVSKEEKEQLEMIEKIKTANEAIGKILKESGLTLKIDHVIRLMPNTNQEEK